MKIFGIFLAMTIAASASTTNPVPAGWKKIVDNTRKCQYAVPHDWIQNKTVPGATASPDRATHIALRGRVGLTLAQVKRTTPPSLRPDKIIEDTPKRYWYSWRDSDADRDTKDTNWIVSVAGNGAACIAQINFRNPADAPVIRSIVNTIAPVNNFARPRNQR